jgi:hypothetical protein
MSKLRQTVLKNTFDNSVHKFRTIAEAAKELNCSHGAISNLVHGRTKTFGNWKLHRYRLTNR